MPGEGQTMWQSVLLKGTALPGKEGFDDGDWIEAPYITDSGIRLLQTGNIGIGEFFDKTSNRKFISQRSFDELRCKWVNPGDVLICRLADPIGRACRVPDEVGPSVTAVDCTIYRTDPTVADSGFMLHKLNSRAQLAVAGDVAGGSTRQRISRGNLGALEFQLPPLPEQRRIAEILDTLDEAIRKTEQVIKKLQQMKQGLLHDLLTRGINEHGELRDPQRHPEQFKESPLGRIPKEWEVETLADALTVELGFAFRSEDYVEEGLLSFRVSNIDRKEDDFGETRHLPGKFWDLFPRQRLLGGEIVLVMVGATTGKLGRVPVSVCPALQNQNMWHLKPKDGVLRDFLWLVLPGAVQRHMALSQGSARDFLTQKSFLPTTVVRPEPDEQERLVTEAQALDLRVAGEVLHLKKLRTLKQGLMDDLLTGRVRVNVEEATA